MTTTAEAEIHKHVEEALRLATEAGEMLDLHDVEESLELAALAADGVGLWGTRWEISCVLDAIEDTHAMSGVRNVIVPELRDLAKSVAV